MYKLTQLFLRSAMCVLTAATVSCITTNPLDESGSGLNGSTDVSLSDSIVIFDMFGGSAGIQIKSGIPLLFKNPLSNDDYWPQTSAMDTYFAGNGKPMEVSRNIFDNILLIHVEKSEMRQSQCDTVSLYDQSGVKRASVIVKQMGNVNLSNDLGAGGRQVVAACQRLMSNALAQTQYIENCYTGFINDESIQRPLGADNLRNITAYNASVMAVNYINDYIKQLKECDVPEETPYYVFLKSILYTDMADKWGNVPVLEPMTGEETATHWTPEGLLRYAQSSLDGIATYFPDRKSWGYTTDPETMYHPTKDVWRMAMAQISMRLGEYDKAAVWLQQIVDSNRYELTGDNWAGLNSETIWTVDQVGAINNIQVVYYTYTDALLMLAECKWRQGDSASATAIINEIAAMKDMILAGDLLSDMDLMRQYLCQAHYFAFQKRNSLGGYSNEEKLWAIPGTNK